MLSKTSQPLFEVRSSPIEGIGAFAIQPISKGTRIIEYLGDRLTPEQAEARHEGDLVEDARVLLFWVDEHTVSDGSIRENMAQYLNHSCDPNCESLIEAGRIYFEALQDIAVNEELTFDYWLEFEEPYEEAWKADYPCRCGAKTCRGTLMMP
jgi:SET domain-containing protein